MIAYKFRAPSQIEFSLDILFNNRLYCADWGTLNDPMEGVFTYSHHATDEKDYSTFLGEIASEKQKLKVCSLSKTFDCHLLWAHYAAGFTGMAIEVELPDSTPDIVDVQYRGVFANVAIANETAAAATARSVLGSKYSEWEYEREVRVLQPSTWYKLPKPVRRLIVGHRMNPSLFEALRIVCEKKEIVINRTGIGDEGIDADHVPKLGEPW